MHNIKVSAKNIVKNDIILKNSLNQIKQYKLICIKCGKEYNIKIKEYLFLKGNYRKTCSSKCAHSRLISKEIKQKISNTLKNKLKRKPTSKNIGLHKINCKKCQKQLYVKASLAEYCHECSDLLNIKHYQLYDKNGKKFISEKTRKKLSEKTKVLMKEGKIKPWQTRNIKSYAEKFFENILNINKILFEREKHISKYFLDFVIKTPKRLIDLEIDGKQHLERKQHDQYRDNKLIELGYYVYRIPWNEINTSNGKLLMKNKIENFLKFYYESF